MKAISIRQPWAWLIVNGHKDIENRTWKTKFRGKILIHASKTMTSLDYSECQHVAESLGVSLPSPQELRKQMGGIVGYTHIVDCVRESHSPWFFGPYGFSLKGSRVLPFEKTKGMLGIFDKK